MQSDLPLLLFVYSRKALNLQKITFPDFAETEPLSLIFKTDNRQSFFHSVVLQKNELRPFMQLLNFFDFAPHPLQNVRYILTNQ